MLDGVRRVRLMLDTAGLLQSARPQGLSAIGGTRFGLVELNVVEQRYRVVLEVLEDGLPVTEVAMRHGVQPVHGCTRGATVVSLLTGVDDHSRFCVCAGVMQRAGLQLRIQLSRSAM